MIYSVHLLANFNYISSVLTKFDLRELLSRLFPVRAKWYNFGLGLGLSSDDLDAIKNSEHCEGPDNCLREVLKGWLSTKNPEKADLINALRQPFVGYHCLANELLTWPPVSLACSELSYSTG